MASGGRSLGEWAVLALLSEGPSHPYDLARQLGGDGPLGRVYTMRRPLVYRAVDRLEADGLVAAAGTEPGTAGPERKVFRISDAGRQRLEGWLTSPVAHIRDLRLAFLLKVQVLRRRGRSPSDLAAAQLRVLGPALDRLMADGGTGDEVDLWRRHNAAAAAAFLEDLIGR
jgi:PadR family transcriptional regulator AphA